MTTVTFKCDCPQSHVGVFIADPQSHSVVASLLFQLSCSKNVLLRSGQYNVAYRVQGTPETSYALTVTGGGTMAPAGGTVPEDGQDGGICALFVPVVALLVTLLVATGAAAQGQAGSGSIDRREKAEASLTTLPNISDVQRQGVYVIAQANADQKSGTAALAVENTPGTFSLSLTLTGPLDQTTRQTPLTLRGLSNSSNVGMGLHWFHWPGYPDIAAMSAMCMEAFQRPDCKAGEFSTPAQRRRFLRLDHAGDAPIILNASASIGRNGFNYLDRSTLASQSTAHTDWSVDGSIGRYTPTTGYLAVEYQYQRVHQANLPTQLCLPLAGTAALQCRNAVIGAPRLTTLNIGDVEWRFFFVGGRAAIDASVARDFTGDVTMIDVPVYFLPGSSGGLTGGARASWRSDTRDMAVALFIGAALKLTP